MNTIMETLGSFISGIIFSVGSALIVIEILREIYGEEFPLNSPLDIFEGIVVGAILVIIAVFIYIKIPEEEETKKEEQS